MSVFAMSKKTSKVEVEKAVTEYSMSAGSEKPVYVVAGCSLGG